MRFYKIYKNEAEALQKQTMKGGLKYAPIPDINGYCFISEVEHNNCGLGVESEFVPPPPVNIDLI